jgi:hypothetical protein
VRRRSLGRRDARDRGFDQNIVRPADHDQMFDIVSPYEHELALPVEIEDIDNGKPRLVPAAAVHGDPPVEQNPPSHDDEDADGDEQDEHQQNGNELVVAE